MAIACNMPFRIVEERKFQEFVNQLIDGKPLSIPSVSSFRNICIGRVDDARLDLKGIAEVRFFLFHLEQRVDSFVLGLARKVIAVAGCMDLPSQRPFFFGHRNALYYVEMEFA
jgi:hypothetical protein